MATIAPRPTRPPVAKSSPSPSSSADAEAPDGPYARVCISLLRRVLRTRTKIRSPRPGYTGLVEECRTLLAKSGPGEQQSIVESLLHAAVIPPVGIFLFRNLFAHRPAFNAALTPLAFSWLVGPAETNRPPEGGHGVIIEKCRFLEEANCKGLCVNMCQQPVQNLFTDTLGLPLRMTPDYETNSCQMAFGVKPLLVDEDPAASGECLATCKMAGAYRKLHTADKCYIESLTRGSR